MAQIRIAVVGHSGAGKSTFVTMARRHCEERRLTVDRFGLAEPLYELQQRFRAVAGVDQSSAAAQDQILLETIATQLRRLNPHALVRPFLRKVADSAADVVFNDDLRDVAVDEPALRAAGFELVRIVAPDELRSARRRNRGDVSVSDESTRSVDEMRCRYTVENRHSLADYENSVRAVMERLLDS